MAAKEGEADNNDERQERESLFVLDDTAQFIAKCQDQFFLYVWIVEEDEKVKWNFIFSDDVRIHASTHPVLSERVCVCG